MTFLRTSRYALVLTTFVVIVAAAQAAQESQPDSKTSDQLPQANPGRPTISTPATLTPVGYLQLETGLLGAEKSEEFSNRTAIEAVFKLSLTKRLELLAQTEPLVFSDLGPRSDRSSGDIFGGLQAVIYPGEGLRPTLAVSYFRRVYSGPAPDVDIGSSRQSALFLASLDIRKFHIDANAIIAEQISDDTRVHRAQFGQTLSVSHPIRGKLGMTGELWHFSQPLSRSNAVGLLLAPTYTVNRLLVLDAGFNRGLTRTSTRWEAFVGVTYLFPHRLW
jgi:hypothetical protein